MSRYKPYLILAAAGLALVMACVGLSLLPFVWTEGPGMPESALFFMGAIGSVAAAAGIYGIARQWRRRWLVGFAILVPGVVVFAAVAISGMVLPLGFIGEIVFLTALPFILAIPTFHCVRWLSAKWRGFAGPGPSVDAS